MREEYISQVKKELSLSKRTKNEIIRDLNEIFSSAVENGETEEQVIRRLGTPKEFADSTAEQFGKDNRLNKLKKATVISAISAIIGIISFVIYILAVSGRKQSEGVIGQANSATDIVVEGGFDPIYVFMTVGIVCVLLGIIFANKAFKLRKK